MGNPSHVGPTSRVAILAPLVLVGCMLARTDSQPPAGGDDGASATNGGDDDAPGGDVTGDSAPVPATRIVLSGPELIRHNTCSGPYTAETRDDAGVNRGVAQQTSVTLSGSASFFADANCGSAIAGAVLLPPGASSFELYIVHTAAESITLAATDTSGELAAGQLVVDVLRHTWTWISGSETVEDAGRYGTITVSSVDNRPPARTGAVGWTDGAGRLWLFGGEIAGGRINDLWRCGGGAWTWMAGSSTPDVAGAYGELGVASPGNVPGARSEAVAWTVGETFWLFGGNGVDSVGNIGRLNDLWRYAGGQWTWMAGSDVRQQPGVYGTPGTGDPTTTPGARNELCGGMVDSNGHLWLFGGLGYDATGNTGRLNDLWRYDHTYWVWESGSDSRSQNGVWGTPGVPAPGNVPSSRHFTDACWIDAGRDLWLFAGDGLLASGGATGDLSDLWRYDGTNWTWMAGPSTADELGRYGTRYTPDTSNRPGGRHSPVSWNTIDAVWVFGGIGYGASGGPGWLNDLWRWDGSGWVWFAGAQAVDAAGSYGTQGEPGIATMPGARADAVSFVDGDGRLWLFGGWGRDSAGTLGRLNDLWTFIP